MLKKIAHLFAIAGLSLVLPSLAFAYEVPRQDSKTNYFYIFGPQGNPYDGKESDTFELFVDVPKSSSSDVVIEVYDPDTGGKLDAGVAPWDTSVEFSVSGSSSLDKKTFGEDAQYDGKRYKFGPYKPSEGKSVGDKYRFTLKAKALSGDDMNVFNVRISPNQADAFSKKFTFILLSNTGDKMYFYPEVPKGVTRVTARNYDLDKEGGSSRLTDPLTRKEYPIKDSVSAQWSETNLSLADGVTRRLKYQVTTKYQRQGKAGLEFLDESGNALPIYFRKGPKLEVPKKPAPAPAPAVNACNRFTFDARSSYDEDNDKITYLWDFGDGQTSTEPVVTHVYQSGGNYNVRLTVTDNSGLECETATTTQSVDVNTPPTARLESQNLTCVGQSVTLDASGSSDDQTTDLTYLWSFSDGTQETGKKVTKVFDRGGTYDVRLTVDDNASTSCSMDQARQTIRVNTAPVAEAGKDVSICLRDPKAPYRVNLDGSGSFDADKDALDYSWSLGDGNTASGRSVEHVYDKGGSYTARLTVSDNSGASCSADTDTVNIFLEKAPIAVAAAEKYTCAGTEVTFDGSGSYGEEGQALTYKWDFGDGTTGTGKTATHTYKQGGEYTATLMVSNGNDSDCATAIDTVKVYVNSTPVADLSDVQASCVGDKLTFNAGGSTDPDGNSLKYTWDFGDGNKVEGGSKVSHRFDKGGSYLVAVQVDDKSGTACSTSRDSIFVKVNTPPIADAGENVVCCEGQNNNFDASGSSDADGDSLTYRWSFGDGETATGSSANHVYNERGTYKVMLTVDDGSGTTCSASSDGFQANVNVKPVPIIKIKQS